VEEDQVRIVWRQKFRSNLKKFRQWAIIRNGSELIVESARAEVENAKRAIEAAKSSNKEHGTLSTELEILHVRHRGKFRKVRDVMLPLLKRFFVVFAFTVCILRALIFQNAILSHLITQLFILLIYRYDNVLFADGSLLERMYVKCVFWLKERELAIIEESVGISLLQCDLDHAMQALRVTKVWDGV
jgi:hypothetical protein